VVLLLAVLAVGYVVAVFLTRDIWTGREGTRVTVAAKMRDGSPPSPDAMRQAVNDVQARLDGRGVSDAEIVADGTNVVATLSGRDLGTDALHDIFGPGETQSL
jgi:preprotein translocase subunit SecD